MTDAELLNGLRTLGLSEPSWRAVTLLPLVEVAWADGEVQPAERARILASAHADTLLVGPAGDQVRTWLERPPPPEHLALGRELLVALVHRHRGPGADLGPDFLDDIERRCDAVASAAGGLLGIAFTIHPEERRAIAQIGRALRGGSAELLDDLPTPDGGAFRDL